MIIDRNKPRGGLPDLGKKCSTLFSEIIDFACSGGYAGVGADFVDHVLNLFEVVQLAFAKDLAELSAMVAIRKNHDAVCHRCTRDPLCCWERLSKGVLLERRWIEVLQWKNDGDCMLRMVTCEPGVRLFGIIGTDGNLELVERSIGDIAGIELLNLKLQSSSKVVVVSKGHSAIASKCSFHVFEHECELILVKLTAWSPIRGKAILVIRLHHKLFTLRRTLQWEDESSSNQEKKKQETDFC